MAHILRTFCVHNNFFSLLYCW